GGRLAQVAARGGNGLLDVRREGLAQLLVHFLERFIPGAAVGLGAGQLGTLGAVAAGVVRFDLDGQFHSPSYAWKEMPQPQLRFAFGLWKRKPPSSRLVVS